jgi:hypothetical protein
MRPRGRSTARAIGCAGGGAIGRAIRTREKADYVLGGAGIRVMVPLKITDFGG